MTIDYRPGLDDRTTIDPEALAYVRPLTGAAETLAKAAGRAEEGTAAQNTERVARLHGSGYWTSQTGGDGSNGG